MNRNPRITVSIDRLALRGFTADEGAALARTFRSELARLIAAPGALTRGQTTPRGTPLTHHAPLDARRRTRGGGLATQAAARVVERIRT